MGTFLRSTDKRNKIKGGGEGVKKYENVADVIYGSPLTALQSLHPGYDRSIPGLPRYSIMGSAGGSVFSLQITNVSIADDADFECQGWRNRIRR